MHKLEALIPLLGWFYITLFAFVLITWLLRGRFAWLQKLYYLVFGAMALMLAGQSLLDEAKLFPVTKKTLLSSSEQKIINEDGGFYASYYLDLRPAVSKGVNISLPNVDIREYYYARMYLYPAHIVADETQDTTQTIIDTGSLDHFPGNFTVIKKGKQKTLIQPSPLASPAASPQPQVKGAK